MKIIGQILNYVPYLVSFNFLHTPFIFQFHNKIKKCFKYFQTEDQLGEKLLMGPLRQNTDHWFGQKKICFSEMEATHTQME